MTDRLSSSLPFSDPEEVPVPLDGEGWEQQGQFMWVRTIGIRPCGHAVRERVWARPGATKGKLMRGKVDGECGDCLALARQRDIEVMETIMRERARQAYVSAVDIDSIVLSDENRQARLETFTARPGTEAALQAMKALVEDIKADKEANGFVLTGGPGGGKSHLGFGAVNALRDAGVPALGLTMADLLDALRHTFDDEDEGPTEGEIFSRLRRARLLFLDDLGTRRLTEWGKERFFQVLQSRMGDGKTTVFASNLPIRNLKAWMDDDVERCWSRFLSLTAGGGAVEVTASDLRKERALRAADERRKGPKLEDKS